MLTLYQCKPAFQNWLRPLVHQLAQRGITPNQLTVAALLLSGVMGLAIANFPQSPGCFLIFPFVLGARMALNALDGLLARNYNLTTPLGCLLNEIGDVVSDAALYLPFSLIPGIAAPWIVGIVLLASLTEMVGVLGWAMTGTRRYEGPMGKSDRALVFSVIALGLGLGLEPKPGFTWIWLGIIILQLGTLVNRVRAILAEATPC
ncbi:MAG: CDP-alcohol phosphatidyltransferase family protein [Acaryochloris sp. RU_4_1]|nr:CDP-alcohol phosphatidyltransferase family protein [Acaryochloris sp. RU_4_1]NJN38540.1 CDP-alcohol phosphatidyltransferase family protein [Acaryochloridaceae cyanobacterium CSU_3_4]NJR56417.1 CDP-alcohol phosphatidyltransferase family protein [Acaryochloris sp. CRU_2_0]